MRAAWLPFPSLALEPLPQRYVRESETTYRYESRGGQFMRALEVLDHRRVGDPGVRPSDLLRDARVRLREALDVGLVDDRLVVLPLGVAVVDPRLTATVGDVAEAVELSQRLGAPVKVIWTREDDITQGPYRPGMLSHMQGFVEAGKITGFHHHAIGESILGQVFKGLADGEADATICEELSTKNNKYQFTRSEKVSWTNVKTEIPIMWWRSVNASNFAFGQECFIDELAHLAGKDPMLARMELLQDARCRKVLETL